MIDTMIDIGNNRRTKHIVEVGIDIKNKEDILRARMKHTAMCKRMKCTMMLRKSMINLSQN